MVWVDSRYLNAAGESLEVRSNVPGFLDAFSGLEHAAGDEIREAVVSVVGERKGSAGLRRLPGLYFGKALMWTDRSGDELAAPAERLLDTIRGASIQATFMLRACRFEGRYGLYGKDVLNRSTYRRKLERLGFTFSDDPFVVLNEDGTFHSSDVGRFAPSFFIQSSDSEDPTRLIVLTPAMAVYAFLSYRLGRSPSGELPVLIDLARNLRVVGASDPRTIVDGLRPARHG